MLRISKGTKQHAAFAYCNDRLSSCVMWSCAERNKQLRYRTDGQGMAKHDKFLLMLCVRMHIRLFAKPRQLDELLSCRLQCDGALKPTNGHSTWTYFYTGVSVNWCSCRLFLNACVYFYTGLIAK